MQYKAHDAKIIACVKKNEVLYNYKSKNFSNKRVRNKIWRNIAGQLGLSITMCRLRWNCLKMYYIKMLTEDSNRKIGWIREGDMDFLRPFVKDKILRVPTNISADPEANNDHDNNCNDSKSYDDNAQQLPQISEQQEKATEISEENNISHGYSMPDTPSSPFPRAMEPKPQVLESVSLAGNYSNITLTPFRDVLNKFFETAAETVRDFPPALQVRVKWEISKIIHQAEMENIQQSQAESYIQSESNMSQATMMYANNPMHLQFPGECTSTKYE